MRSGKTGTRTQDLLYGVFDRLECPFYQGSTSLDVIDKIDLLPICYRVASVHQRKDSKYWYCTFRVLVVDPETRDETWRQFQKNTKEIDRKKAQRAAEEIEEATRKEYGTGKDNGRKMLAILREATEEAMHGTLSETFARKCLSDIFAVANGTELLSYTTRQWFDEWLKRKERTVKPGTYSLYRLALDAFAAWLGDRALKRIESVSSQDIRCWRDQLHDEGRTGKTVGQYQKSVSSALRAAVNEGILLRNPADSLECLPKEDSVKREPFSEEEVRRLIAYSDPQWALTIKTAYYTGLRLRDITNLKWCDVNLTNGGTISVEPLKQARKKVNKKRLELPMHPALHGSFAEYPSSDDPESFVFPDLATRDSGGSYGLSWQFTQIMTKAGVDPMIKRTREEGQAGRSVSARGFHSLRHTFISALANSGVSPELRQELSGHDDADSHKIYTHVDRERMKGALSQMPDL